MNVASADAIHRQLAFLAELDHLKSVVRQSPLVNRSRRENSAEHSWRLAMFALVLSGHAEGVAPLHVVKLLLVHDIVEIDAGDAPIHVAGTDKAALEQEERRAAERIFGLLPPERGRELLGLWMEFEAAETPAARFAKALDRLRPLLLNALTDRRWLEAPDVGDDLNTHFPAIGAAYLAEGRARAGRVGATDAVLASAGDLVPFASSYLAGALGLSSG
jgi:putative hydrolase of HD superfamily